MRTASDATPDAANELSVTELERSIGHTTA